MTEQPGGGTARRVARNTAARAIAEVVGKFASLLLMAVLAREEGPAGLGVLIFALAWCEIAMAPTDMGYDRWFLRLVARDRAALDHSFFNVLLLKATRAVVVIPLSWLVLRLLGYEGDTFAVVCLLTFAYLLDTLSYTVHTAFNGIERGDLVGVALAAQRLAAAGLGIAVLGLGYGVVTVAAAYLAGSAVGFAVAMVLLGLRVGMPRRATPRAPRRDLVRVSRPFAGQELLSIGLSRLDVLLVSAIASQAVVGTYGAAYRLLEATLFIPTAIQGAVAAMYTYLDHSSEPTIGAAFQRSIKLALVLLVPCAVPLVVLPGPLLELFFGAGFGGAAGALRALGPTVVLLGVVLLAVTLMSSRLEPRRLVTYYAVALVVNVAANLALIPLLGATGAAVAMLLTELVLAVLALRDCVRETGPIDVLATAAGPLAGGLAMAGVLLALEPVLPLAVAAGGVAYLAVLAGVDRFAAPADLSFVAGVVRRRLPGRHAARV